jgi:hypothetical protein
MGVQAWSIIVAPAFTTAGMLSGLRMDVEHSGHMRPHA